MNSLEVNIDSKVNSRVRLNTMTSMPISEDTDSQGKSFDGNPTANFVKQSFEEMIRMHPRKYK